jgi:hypothetical protein
MDFLNYFFPVGIFYCKIDNFPFLYKTGFAKISVIAGD